jgi:predicted acyltransferase
MLLRRTDLRPESKAGWLAGWGIVALVLGSLWGLQFPVVKKLWTSSFVLVAGGWSLLLLAAFHYVVDIRGWKRWCQPFVWVGMNAITLYVVSGLVNFRAVGQRLVGGDVKAFLEDTIGRDWGELAGAIMAVMLLLWLARFLYRRQIFLRL